MPSAPVSVRYLPVWIVVKRSFAYSWECRAIFAGPYAIYAAVTVLADLLIGYAAGAGGNIPSYAVSGIEEVFAMAFAVGIHRFVLLGEFRPGSRFFDWGRHFFQYILTALSLFLVGAVVLLMSIGIVKGESGDLSANTGALGFLSLIMFAGTVWVGLSLCRLSLTLPAAALGDPLPAKAIWRATARNGFRIFAATLLSIAPFLIVEGALIRLFPMPGGLTGLADSGLGGLLVIVAIGLISPLQMIVMTVALALQYDVLVRGRGPAANHPI